jgi:hypothetical protein
LNKNGLNEIRRRTGERENKRKTPEPLNLFVGNLVKGKIFNTFRVFESMKKNFNKLFESCCSTVENMNNFERSIR